MTVEKKKFESRFGEIEITKSNDWSKGLNGFNVTPYFQEIQAFAGQADNYTMSVAWLEKLLRVSVSRSQVERITKSLAGQLEDEGDGLAVAQLERSADLVAAAGDDTNVYCMVDGSMLQTREGAKSNDWKEVKLGRIFMDSEILGVDKHHNWIRKSIYSAYLGDSQSFLNNFEPIVDTFEPLGKRLVFVGDGAKWIWKWIGECYSEATQILDFYHAVEHLSKFAKVYFTKINIRKAWLATARLDLLNDRVGRVIENVGKLLRKTKKSEEQRESLLTYMRNNESRMMYGTFQEMGLSIGSGAIESAHRTVLQKRLKQSGQRWTLSGAQKIIDLRIMNMNQQWHKVIQLLKKQEISLFSKTG